MDIVIINDLLIRINSLAGNFLLQHNLSITNSSLLYLMSQKKYGMIWNKSKKQIRINQKPNVDPNK